MKILFAFAGKPAWKSCKQNRLTAANGSICSAGQAPDHLTIHVFRFLKQENAKKVQKNIVFFKKSACISLGHGLY